MDLWKVALCVAIASCFLFTGGNTVESLRFLIIGDMGGVDYEPYSTYVERCTAQEMGKVADRYSPQYILELGDNFYYEGVTNVHDMRFKKTFEEIYTAKSLQVPWYLVAGNHDHRGNVSAQIEYSKLSPRWNFPNYYYYKEFSAPGFAVGFMMMDTVQLCGVTDDWLGDQPDGPEDPAGASAQWDYVEKVLMTSKSQYLFSAGHYPVYSVAEHGPTKCLEDRLQPMLDKYTVNGHLSGHDHNLQHLRVKSSKGANIDYLVSGMANFIKDSKDHQKDVPAGSSLFFNANVLSKGGFLYAETTAQNMTLTFINALGEGIYTTVIYPRKL